MGAKQQLPPSSLATFSPSLEGRSAITTLAPFFTSLWTVARPKPEAPPVTRHTAFCKVAAMLVLHVCWACCRDNLVSGTNEQKNLFTRDFARKKSFSRLELRDKKIIKCNVLLRQTKIAFPLTFQFQNFRVSGKQTWFGKITSGSSRNIPRKWGLCANVWQQLF